MPEFDPQRVVFHATNQTFESFQVPAWFALAREDAKTGGEALGSQMVKAMLDVQDPCVLDETEMDEFKVATGVSTDRANRWAQKRLEQAESEGHDGLLFPHYAILVPSAHQIRIVGRELQTLPTPSTPPDPWYNHIQNNAKKGVETLWYHGTHAQDFQTFDTSADHGMGAHFGNLKQALSFATGEQGRIHTVRLALENPIRLQDSNWLPEIVAEELVQKGIYTENQADAIQSMRDVDARIKLVKDLQGLGFDAIVYQNAYEGNGHCCVVFDPAKIDVVDVRPAAEHRCALAAVVWIEKQNAKRAHPEKKQRP